jgi:hypothetical protein
MEGGVTRAFWGYLGRFVLLHTATYTLFGVLFLWLSDYATFLSSPQMEGFMRPADDPVVALGIPLQIPRGLLLGLALWPFREVFIRGRWGWLKLLGVMFVLMSVGAVVTAPGTLEGMVYTKFGFGNPLVGFPEIISQMAAFSWLLVWWEQRAARIRSTRATAPPASPAGPRPRAA